MGVRRSVTCLVCGKCGLLRLVRGSTYSARCVVCDTPVRAYKARTVPELIRTVLPMEAPVPGAPWSEDELRDRVLDAFQTYRGRRSWVLG